MGWITGRSGVSEAGWGRKTSGGRILHCQRAAWQARFVAGAFMLVKASYTSVQGRRLSNPIGIADADVRLRLESMSASGV
jgi:hypothetical protein